MKNRFWALVLLFLFACGARAGEVTGLYNSALLVPEQHREPATEHLAEGLAQVLIRVSGNRNILGKPAVREALQTPGPFLRGFEFRNTGAAIADANGNQQRAQALALQFDNTQVDALLRNASERPLGSQRPTVMLWLAAEQNNRRDYVSPDGRAMEPLLQRAEMRGLPVQLPLYDLTDQQDLPISDLWGQFQRGIEQASGRYRPDATLAGRMRPDSNGQWLAEWMLLSQSGVQRFTTGGTADQALTDAADQVADRLFSALAGVGGSNYMEGLQLDITNIRTLGDFTSVVDYLKQLTLVNTVQVEQVNGTRVLLRVQLDGRAQQLERAIRLEPRMAPVVTDVVDNGEQLSLSYRWQG